MACFLLAANLAHALIQGGTGNDPLTIAGWPIGAADVFNAAERVAWWEGPPFGGGQWHGEFRGNAEAVNRALRDFARIETDAKRLVVHDGIGHSFWLNPNREEEKDADARIDWTFVVWDEGRWDQLQNLPADLRPRGGNDGERPVPQIDVYAGGNIRWEDVQVPEGIEMVDERLEAHGFKPADGTVLEGTVVDLATQMPVVARMRLERVEPQPEGGYKYTEVAAATADETGRWVLKSAPAGWHRVVAEADGYVPRVVSYGQLDGEPRWSEYNTRLSRPATVTGRVADAEGRPLAGVTVRLQRVVVEPGGRYESPTDYKVTTDRDGRFVAAGLPIGRTTISVSKPGYCRPGLGLSVETPAADISLAMVRSATVEVTVHFSDVARPNGYLVELVPEGGEAVGLWSGTSNIDAEGKVKFENVPPGTYILTGRPNPGNADQETQPVPIRLEGGEAWTATLKAK